MYLDKALRSLLKQDYPAIESIVVDGGSTDRTLRVVGDIGISSVIVLPGSGLYEALNVGIRNSTGEIIVFLNSDDLLASNTFLSIASMFVEDPLVDVVCGQAISFKQKNGGPSEIENNYDEYNGRTMDIDTLLFGIPLMNAHYFRSAVFETIGCFSEQYRLAADREFMIRVCKKNLNYRYFFDITYRYRIHDKSLTLNSSRSNAFDIGLEHIELAQELLDETSRDRHLYEKFLQFASVTAMFGAIRSGNFRAALRIFQDRLKENYSWIPNMVKIVFSKLVGRVNIWRKHIIH